MRNFDLTPLYRASVGFDRMADVMDRALSADIASYLDGQGQNRLAVSTVPIRTSSGGSGAGTGNSYSLGLNASWELDLWGRLSGAVDASQAQAQASSADLAAARLSLQASLAQAYFALRTAEAQQRLLQESLAAYEQSWQLTRNRERAGVASPADVAQAEPVRSWTGQRGI